MCGICGYISFKPHSRQLRENMVLRMTDSLKHRGPDDSGIWSDATATLGHRRLTIIDLTHEGHQPMISEDASKVLVFNGEIYNFLELKKQFAKEISFRYQNDTEVILRLYEKFGPDCLRYLRGMFAIAIWDSNNRELFLARDRVGKKPLFYFLQNDKLIFSSELHAVTASEEFDFRLNHEALYHYLTLQYVPSPLTIYKDVFKLPPAHYAVFKNGTLSIRRYWSLKYQPRPWREEEALEQLDNIFTESVRLRMIADVPLGAFLSGGMDSSSVVATMSRLSPRPVKTFSISFEEQDFNEVPFAREVAAYYHTDHEEFTVKAANLDVLQQLAYHYSEPYADSSAIPTFFLSQMTRQRVKVALNGDGGDELFGGYDRYQIRNQSTWQPLFQMIKPLATIFPDNMRYVWRINRFVTERAVDLASLYMKKICYFKDEEKRNLFTSEFNEQTEGFNTLDWLRQRFDHFRNVPFPQRLMSVDTETYLPDALLVKVDIASMACSLEARSPFLDHQMMEFAASLPLDFKIRRGTSKYLLKMSMQNKLPASVIRRPKMGFGVPIQIWFRGELLNYLKDVLLSSTFVARQCFRRTAVETLIDEHVTARADNTSKLYALLMLELWHHAFLDGKNSVRMAAVADQNSSL